MNIVEIAQGSDDFNILVKAVVAADLAGALSAPDADLTVFAPTDAAFVNLAQAFGYAGDPADEDAVFDAIANALAGLAPDGDPIPILTDVLLYHVSAGVQDSTAVLGSTTINTLLGVDIGQSGGVLSDQDPDFPDPNIATPDIMADNGIIHVIDNVLIPIDIPTVVNGSNGADSVTGGPGLDIIAGAQGDDTLDGADGGDIIYGNQGGDQIYGGNSGDMAYGGQGADWVWGESGDDWLFGNMSDDTVSGGAGNDVIYGNQGADELHGGEGDDTVFGGQGDDIIYGNDGNDMLAGNRGDDWLHGGAGNDKFVYNLKNDGTDTVDDFNDGEDMIYLAGGSGGEMVTATNVAGGAMVMVDGAGVMMLNGFDAADFDANDYMFA